MNRPLVVCKGDSEEPVEPNVCGLDPVFQLGAARDLRLAVETIGDDGIEYIVYRVGRSPRDLCNHVRRIVLTFALADSEGLYAALIDLFIVLGDKGAALRRRVLEGAKSHLNREQYCALLKCVESGFDEGGPLPMPTGSMLSSGAIGTRRLVEVNLDAGEAPRDPLVEAREYLDYCQIEQARSLLEQAVLDQSQRMELHETLLEIYRSSRDRSGFNACWQRLNETDNPADDLWRETANHFATGEVRP